MQRVSYLGPERRRTSNAERDRYAREHDLSNPKGVLLSWFGSLPRPVLAVIALAGSGYMGNEAWAWKVGVDGHVSAAEQGFQRLAIVERLSADLALSQQGLRDELRAMREEQLHFYRWLAGQRQDGDKVREIDNRLRSLDEEKP